MGFMINVSDAEVEAYINSMYPVVMIGGCSFEPGRIVRELDEPLFEIYRDDLSYVYEDQDEADPQVE